MLAQLTHKTLEALCMVNFGTGFRMNQYNSSFSVKQSPVPKKFRDWTVLARRETSDPVGNRAGAGQIVWLRTCLNVYIKIYAIQVTRGITRSPVM
jgi:hypothetical protein